MPYLVVQTGTDSGRRHPIGNDTIVLGRGAGTLPVDDIAASRRHAEIFRVGELCFIKDLKSRNGTYLNEARVDEELLKSGDRIRIGSTIYVFADEEAEELAEEVSFGEEGAPRERGETTFIAAPPRRADPGASVAGRQIETFRKVVQDLTEIHDRATLRRQALAVVARSVRAEFGYWFAPDNSTAGFRGLAQFGEVADVSVSRSILRYAATHHQTVLTEDASADQRFKGNRSVMLRKIHSVLCVPVGRREDSREFLYLGRDFRQESFAESEMQTASFLGDLVTLALEACATRETEQEMWLTTARTLVQALEMRNPALRGHSERVAAIAFSIARAMGLPQPECRRIQLGGLLHDIGRLADAGERPGEPNPPDEARHVLLGERLLSKMPGLSDLLPAVLYHHERADGSGFPKGVAGDRIPVMGRIVAAANALDHSIVEGGEQGTGLLLKDALLAMGQAAGKTFDMEVVRALLVAYRRGTLQVELPAAV